MNARTIIVLMVLFLIPALCIVSQAQDAALATALKTSYAAEAKGDYQAAIKPLTALGTSAASSYIAQLRLGWLNYCSKDWQQSVTFYGNASQLATFAIEPLLGLMQAQQAAGKNDDAINTAQIVLRHDPNNYTATSHAAWMLYQKADYKQAATMYHKLVNLYPSDTEMLLGLGFALKLAGDKKESMQYFNTVLLLSPNNARALEGLRDNAVEPPSGSKYDPTSGPRTGLPH